jgi:hypothetical protein
MGYTKILEKDEWNRVVTEDLDVANKRKPLFILATRFKVYSLRINNFAILDERKIAYVIEGDSQKERAIVFLKINLAYNMVDSVTMKRSLSFDKELAYLLKMALLVRIRNMDIYYFPAKILNESVPK